MTFSKPIVATLLGWSWVCVSADVSSARDLMTSDTAPSFGYDSRTASEQLRDVWLVSQLVQSCLERAQSQSHDEVSGDSPQEPIIVRRRPTEGATGSVARDPRATTPHSASGAGESIRDSRVPKSELAVKVERSDAHERSRAQEPRPSPTDRETFQRGVSRLLRGTLGAYLAVRDIRETVASRDSGIATEHFTTLRLAASGTTFVGGGAEVLGGVCDLTSLIRRASPLPVRSPMSIPNAIPSRVRGGVFGFFDPVCSRSCLSTAAASPPRASRLLQISRRCGRVSCAASVIALAGAQTVLAFQRHYGYIMDREFYAQSWSMHVGTVTGLGGTYLGYWLGGAVGCGYLSWVTAPLGGFVGGVVGAWIGSYLAALVVEYCYDWYDSLSEAQQQRLFAFIYRHYGVADS